MKKIIALTFLFLIYFTCAEILANKSVIGNLNFLHGSEVAGFPKKLDFSFRSVSVGEA